MNCKHLHQPEFALYCTRCGQLLHQLNIQPNLSSNKSIIYDKDIFIDTDFLLAAALENLDITLEIKNTSSIARQIYLPDPRQYNQSSWVRANSLRRIANKSIKIDPNSVYELVLSIDFENLHRLKSDYISGEINEESISFELRIHEGLYYDTHSSNKFLEGELKSLVKTIRVRPSIPCVPYPNASIYRFLDQKKMDTREHIVELENLSPNPVQIQKVQIHDYLTTSDRALGYALDGKSALEAQVKRIPSQFCIQTGETNIVIPPMEKKKLYLMITNPQKKTDTNGWFGADIKIHHNASTKPAISFLGGFIGQPPSLNWHEPENKNSSKMEAYQSCTIENNVCQFTPLIVNDAKKYSLFVENTGQLPIDIERIEYWTVDAQKRPLEHITKAEENWIHCELIQKEKILPGKTHEFHLGFASIMRRHDEYSKDLLERHIKIYHTGSSDEPLVLTVAVDLGTIAVSKSLLCIDFGTTNSIVTIQEEQENFKVESLEQDLTLLSGLRSLLWFDNIQQSKVSPEEGIPGDIYFGSIAQKQSVKAPNNLVRSIKSQLDGVDKFRFFYKIDGDRKNVPIEYSIQRLLNIFISQLKIKTEEAYQSLEDEDRIKIANLGAKEAKNVIFQNALFTHPVNMSRESLRKLFEAAQSAGLNTTTYHGDPVDFEYFLDNYCLDEASAAIIALITDKRFPRDGEDEKILCVDIGGGTTDISTVFVNEVHGERGFQKMYLDGLKFGGDDVDDIILTLCIEKAFEQGDPQERAACIRAIREQNVTSYVNQIMKKFPNWQEKRVRDTYAAISQVRGHAEKQKITTKCDQDFIMKLPTSTAFKNLENKDIGLSSQSIHKELDKSLKKITHLIEDALPFEWNIADITTVLFTGQTTKLPHIRRYIMEFLRKKALPSECKIIPNDHFQFDPKFCVSQGIGAWNGNRMYLKEHRQLPQVLRRDLGFRNIHTFAPITGMEKGQLYPFDVVVNVGEGKVFKRNIELFERPLRKEQELVPIIEYTLKQEMQVTEPLVFTFQNAKQSTLRINGEYIDGTIKNQRGYL